MEPTVAADFNDKPISRNVCAIRNVVDFDVGFYVSGRSFSVLIGAVIYCCLVVLVAVLVSPFMNLAFFNRILTS